MYKSVDGNLVKMAPEEEALYVAKIEAAERQYWTTISYDDAVDTEVKKQYSPSQEAALMRQKDRKPDEWAAYDQYCEDCKSFVKAKFAEYGRTV